VKIFVVDPSLFTFPYDHEFCQALADTSARVDLFGRPLREKEMFPSEPRYEFAPFFYPLVEKSSPRLSRKKSPNLFLKGLEHIDGMKRFVKEVRSAKPDVIHFQWIPLPLADTIFLKQLKCAAPLMLTVHDTSLSRTKNVSSFVQTIAWKRALAHFDKLIVHTQGSRDKLLEYGIDDNSILVFPIPVLPTDNADQGPAGDIRTEANDRIQTLMIFGEMKPYKGIDIALKALALIPRELRNKIKLVIAGRPRMDVSKLKQLAEDLGIHRQVIWKPEYIVHKDLPSLLETADIFLLPYRSIDASAVLSMVLPYGKPIIASRLGIFKESVEQEKALEDDDLYAAFCANARHAALRLPSWTDMAREVIAAYRRLLQDRA
jgi:glycosyltransferase involved in cell wall biosynthesis